MYWAHARALRVTEVNSATACPGAWEGQGRFLGSSGLWQMKRIPMGRVQGRGSKNIAAQTWSQEGGERSVQ